MTPKTAVGHQLKIKSGSRICPFGLQKHFSCNPIPASALSRGNHLQLVVTDNFVIHSSVITTKGKEEQSSKRAMLKGRKKKSGQWK